MLPKSKNPVCPKLEYLSLNQNRIINAMRGKHIKIVGRGSDALLNNTESLFSFMDDLSYQFEMDPLDKPRVFYTQHGVSGYVMLEAGHISLHAWPYRQEKNKMFVLDIYFYPRYNLDVTEVVTEIESSLGGKKLIINDLSYALEYIGN